MSDKVYEQVIQAAGYFGYSAVEKYTALQVLCGYAKIISSNDSVIGAIFKEQADQDRIIEIRKLFDANNIDASLLKKVGRNLCDAAYSEERVTEFNKILTTVGEDSIALIKKIFSMNLPELSYVKNGKQPEDVFAYVRQIESEQDSEEKPDPDKKESHNEKLDNGRQDTSETVITPQVTDKVKAGKTEQQVVDDIQLASSKDSTDNSEGSSDDIAEGETESTFSSLMKKTMRLYGELRAKVFGQNEAVLTFSRGYFQSELLHKKEVEEKAKPAAVFMFVGPPGVGKTYLAESAAKALDRPVLRLDMAEFVNPDSVNILTGYNKSYSGAKPGKLTQYVSEHPGAIILFDEIEKCSQEVKNLLLEILDGGRATDDYTEKTVDFKNTLIIFTSNAGKSLYEAHDRNNLASLPASVVVKAMSEETDNRGEPLIGDALLSRFRSSNLIMFNHLGAHELIDIIKENFRQCSTWVGDLYGASIEIDKEVAPLLLFTQSNNTDARNISSKSSMLIKDELFELGRHLDDPSQLDSISKIHMSVDLSEADDEIKALFHNNDKSDILFIGDGKDLKDVPLGDRITVHTATNADEIKQVLADENITFIIVDLGFGCSSDSREFLSLDDADAEGIDLFEFVHEKMPDMDIYVLEKNEIKESDKMNFYENGAKGFIRYSSEIDLADRINRLCDEIYMQKQVDYLSGRSRVLTYNTSQEIVDDGKTAEIRFYDLKEKLVTDSEENRTLLSDAEKPKDKFSDVIGAENAKKELMYFIDYLRNPKAFMKKKKVKIPKGILLYGPPGTGKTMLARAMAGEADVTFIPTSAAEFKNKYVGESESNVRKLFSTARKFAPSILFIDEIDSVGLTRGGGSDIANENEGILNQLLTEMDGFEVNLEKPVFVIAATNASIDGQGRSLDPALVRRFDKPIEVDLPDEEERKKYLKLLLDKEGITSIGDDKISSVAVLMTGLSLAIIKNVVDSALRTADEEGRELDEEIFMNALDDYMHGEKREWNEEYYRSVAIHESGHAYMSALAHDIPSLVTIVSRGDYGGYMAHGSQEDRPNYSRDDLLAIIRTSLGGRAAEIEFYGDEKGTNTGIASDLQQATNSAMQIICRYAMSPVNSLSLDYHEVLKTPLAEKLVADANELVNEQFEITQGEIKKGREKIQALADYLVKNNQATGEDVKRIFGIEEQSGDMSRGDLKRF